jgi:peptide/nickel transport system substrate-binding protein
MTHTEDPNRIMAIEFIQQTLSNNGIDAQVSTFEWATFFSRVSAGNYQIALLGLVNIVDPDRYFYQRFRTGAGNNEGGFSNAQLDEYVIRARQESDIAVRAGLYQRAAQIVNDQVAHHVLLNQGYIVMHTRNLQGFTPRPTGSWRDLPSVRITN